MKMKRMTYEDISEGIVCVDKPVGITSFDVIRILRRVLGVKKIGHAGTLDPLASGLMILGVGSGTKELAALLKLPKTYEVRVLFGKRTTTGDLEGEVVEEASAEGLSEKKVTEACASLEGIVRLRVPRHSAVKEKGLPLYKRVRRGEEVVAPEREMEITRLSVRSCERENNVMFCDLEMDVASGTYVRSVVEGIGERAGVPAVVTKLRRTRIGDRSVQDALQLPQEEVDRSYKRFERDSGPSR